MKTSKILLSLGGGLLLIAGVAAAQAAFTLVSGTTTLVSFGAPGEVRCQGTVPTGNPVMPCPPGVSGTVRGKQVVETVATPDARLNGFMFVVSNWNIHADGNINAWGTFRLEVTGGGVWEGVWEGKQRPDGSGSVSASGHGSGGNVEGLQLLFDQTAPPYSLTLSFNARILAPGR